MQSSASLAAGGQTYALAKRSVVAVAVLTAICMLGDSMLYIVMPLHPEQFGLDALWQVGILLGVNRMVRIPLNPVIAFAYHRMSARTGVVVAVLLSALSTGAYALAPGFAWLVVARCMWGIAWGLLRLGGFLSVLHATNDHNRGMMMGLFNGIWSVGGLLGMLAGAFANTIGTSACLWGCFVLTALGFIPALLLVPGGPSAKDPDELTHDRTSIWLLLQKGSVVRIGLSGFLVSLVFFGIVFTTFSKFTAEKLGESFSAFGLPTTAAAAAGILLALRWGSSPILAPAFGRLSDQKGRVPMLRIGLIVSGLLVVTTLFDLPVTAMLALLFAVQIGNTFVSTVMDALASDIAKDTGSKLSVMTLYTLLVDLGAAVGPPIGLSLAGRLSIGDLYAWCGAALLILPVIWFSRRQGSRPLRHTSR